MQRHAYRTQRFPRSWQQAMALSTGALALAACSGDVVGSDGTIISSSEALSLPQNTTLQTAALVTSNKPKLLSGRAGLAFDVNVAQAGAYHVRAWAMGSKGNATLPIYLDDGAKSIGSISTTDSGWRYSDVVSSDGGDVVSLSAGAHKLSFRAIGDRIPDVESVDVSKQLAAPSSAEQNYSGYIAALQARTLAPDYAAAKAAETGVVALAGPSPSDNYCYSLVLPFSYTYRSLFYLTANQSVTFETRKADPYGSDPVLYLFSSSSPQSYSWSNDDYNGYQSRISVTIPATGYYWLLARAYNPSAPGTSDLYKDNALYASNIALAGNRLYCSLNKTGTLNYFTSYITADTMLWLVDQGGSSPGQIRAFNDDWGQPGDVSWGLASRVHRTSATSLSYAIVSAYSSSVSSAWADLYLENEDSDIMGSFPNLKAIDAIKSAPSSSVYNCISYSGGVTGWWEWPLNPGDPWYDPNPLASFDRWYGNNPSRYPGAYTYTRTGATEANSVVDLWALNGTYTHGSVTKPGDGWPHGYWFESKPGQLTRTFHPPYALQGNAYGNVVNFYTWTGGTASAASAQATALGAQPSLQDAVNAGVAVVEQPALTNAETSKLQTLKARLPTSAIQQFEKLYGAWKATWTRPDVAMYSDPKKYAESPEYSKLLSYCQQQGSASWPMLFEKYLAGDRFVLIPIEELATPAHDGDLAKIQQDSARERLTVDGKYVIPSLEANITKFVQVLLGSM